jgi:PAT family beta-lactamase induction signal transducer AmpG
LRIDNKQHFLLLALIGLTNGMIPLLIGSTLFIWLKENGVNLQNIGLYSLANLPFAFSFAISASLEYLSYKKYFSYKVVLILSLICSALAIYGIPAVISQPQKLFILCCALSISATIVRVILLALQKILFSEQKLLVVINISTISFKVGLLVGGSCALFLSQYFPWGQLYHYFAMLIVGFSLIILCFPSQSFNLGNNIDMPQLSFKQRLIAPFTNLWQMPQIGLILLLMFFYRAPDNLITHYFDLFYLHFGLSKTNVAFGYKLYGMITASLGGILCIKLIKHRDYISNLNLALGLHLLSYGLVYWFSQVQAPLWAFYLCVTSEEFSRGMTMIMFWSFQTQICKRQHVLIQLAVLTAIDSLSYSLLSTLGGGLIQHLGYANFILIVISSFIPAFILLKYLKTTPLIDKLAR